VSETLCSLIINLNYIIMTDRLNVIEDKIDELNNLIILMENDEIPYEEIMYHQLECALEEKNSILHPSL